MGLVLRNGVLITLKELAWFNEIVMADQYRIENAYEKLTLGKLIDEINQGSGKYYRCFIHCCKGHPEHLLDFGLRLVKKEKKNKGFLFGSIPSIYEEEIKL